MPPKMTPDKRAAAAETRRVMKSPQEALKKAALGLGASTEALILKRLIEMPSSCRKLYLRAMSGKSLRAAASAQCIECVGWQRDEVRECTDPACPLYRYRPFK